MARGQGTTWGGLHADVATADDLDAALCRTMPAGWWPLDTDAYAPGHTRWNEAATICADCPARKACARDALAVSGYVTGMWAGVRLTIDSRTRRRGLAELRAIVQK